MGPPTLVARTRSPCSEGESEEAAWVLGALTQVAAIIGLLWLGLQVIGPAGPEAEPTVFDYGPLRGLGMGWWATAITTSQVVLLGLTSFLALTPVDRQVSSAAAR